MIKKKQVLRNVQKIMQRVLYDVIFTAYRKTAETEEIIKKLAEDDEKTDFQKIRCPICKWRPSKSSRWFCADCDFPENFSSGCGTMWNTFDTRGKCPTCTHQWIWTSCLQCGRWSHHEDWYAKKAV
jgi:hypothetical protein